MSDLLRGLSTQGSSFAALVKASESEQRKLGYFHTLHEIFEQPECWIQTAHALAAHATQLSDWLDAGDKSSGLLLTGSGSSYYIGASLAPSLQASLDIPVRAVPSGWLLLNLDELITRHAVPGVVSFGRSGNSPESTAAVDLVLQERPECRHLIVTCNSEGKLATQYPDQTQIVLDERVHDKSLVMTNSFTNMWLAGRFLGYLRNTDLYDSLMNQIATTGRRLLTNGSDRLFTIATGSYKSVLYLGSGARFGAAQEASLKMLEMSSGRIATRADTYLGVRHGPLSFVQPDTLIVCFISSDERLRAYELDLVGELGAKGLGSSLVLVGVKIPRERLSDDTITVSYELAETLTDNELSILDVVVGQLLGFFRCLHEGLKPDKPSPDNVITRVVRPFVIHSM